MFFQLFVFAAGRRLTPRSLCCSCAFALCLFFVSANATGVTAVRVVDDCASSAAVKELRGERQRRTC